MTGTHDTHGQVAPPQSRPPVGDAGAGTRAALRTTLCWSRGGDFALLLAVFSFGLGLGVAADVTGATGVDSPDYMRLEPTAPPAALARWQAREAERQQRELDAAVATPPAVARTAQVIMIEPPAAPSAPAPAGRPLALRPAAPEPSDPNFAGSPPDAHGRPWGRSPAAQHMTW